MADIFSQRGEEAMIPQVVHVLGAGSIGLLLATHLSQQHAVRLLVRAAHDDRRHVFIRHEGDTQHRVELPEVAASHVAEPIRHLIVCTKAYDALAAVTALRQRLTADSRLLLMQNGLGSQQEIAARFPGLGVYAATSTEGAYRPRPREVVHAGRGVTRIGKLQGPDQDWAALFGAAGLTAEAVTNIDWHLADKLRINALINPLTVLHRCRNGELLDSVPIRERMQRLGEEVDTLLAAAGYVFERPAFLAASAVAERTAANYSSMYQDAQAGRRLEIDYITGYLLRLAERVALPAPETARVYRQVTEAVA